MPPAERTITSSRAKTLFFLALSLGLLTLTIWAMRQADGADGRLWISCVFFGACAASFAWLLIRPQQLHLDAQGFTIGGGLVRRPKMVAWTDVTGFFVYRLSRRGRMIGYNYAPGARPTSWLITLNHRLGVDGALPKSWPGSPETVAADLNAYRLAALAAAMLPPAADCKPDPDVAKSIC